MQTELGLGTEAGDQLIALAANAAVKAVGDFDAVNSETKGSELVEEDARGDAEAGIGDDVIKYKRVGPVVGGLRAAVGDAIGRKSFADGDVTGEVVVNTAADDEIPGKKLWLAEEEGILSGEARGNGECSKRGCRGKARRAAERKGHNIPPWVVGETQMYLEVGAVDAATEINRAV